MRDAQRIVHCKGSGLHTSETDQTSRGHFLVRKLEVFYEHTVVIVTQPKIIQMKCNT